MNTTPGNRRRVSPPKKSVLVGETEPDQTVVPYDENLLERSRTQWQFGDWHSLTMLDRETLQHHPDRAKLSLLVAAGCLQADQPKEARQYLRLAQEWGCSKKLIAQILAAGVHNSLGRAAAQAGLQERAFRHFESAIAVGTPGADIRLFAQARCGEQLQQLKLHGWQMRSQGQLMAPDESISKPDASAEYLVNIKLRLDNSLIVMLGFNSSKRSWLKIEEDVVEYETEKGTPLYLVSNENGNFEKPPSKVQVPVVADTTYLFSGELAHSGDNRPVVWIFQYAGGRKINAQSLNTEGGRFRCRLRTQATTESVAIGLRLAGKGKLISRSTVLALQERANEELFEFIEDKFEKIKQVHRHEVENSMKQVEACMRLQHYLGPDIILPDMHNWPISPDFGVLLINLVEQNAYDGVIEFGSGTSTLILAKALERVGRREGRASSPLLSFDHLQQYAERTQKLLKQAGLVERTNVVLAPLVPWEDANGQQFSFYACDQALDVYGRDLPATASRLLVVVDGPPAATGRQARYPTLPRLLERFSGKYVLDFVLDDYVRADEQEIVARWLDVLKARNLLYSQTEFNNLEKKAFLIEIRGELTGGGMCES